MTARRLTSIRLVAGASDQAGWTLTEADGRALFRVGSAEECNWQVVADGVAPHQLMLMWNGAELTVIDVGGGEVRIDGQVLAGTAIVRSGRIEFGDAAMEVKSAGGAGVVFNGMAESAASLQGPTWAPGAPRTSAPASMSDVVTLASPARRRGGSHPHVLAARATEVMDAPPVRPDDGESRRRSGQTMTLPGAEADGAPDVGRPLPPGAYAPTAPLGSRRADGQGVSVPSLTVGRRSAGAPVAMATRAAAPRPPAPATVVVAPSALRGDDSRPALGTPASMPAQQLAAPPALPLPPPPSRAAAAAPAVPPSRAAAAPAAPPPPSRAAAAPAAPPPSRAAAASPAAPPSRAAAAPAAPPPPSGAAAAPAAPPPASRPAPVQATRVAAAGPVTAPTVTSRPAAGKARRSAAGAALKATRVPEPVRGPEPPPPAPPGRQRRLPPRTWGLLAVTVAAGVGLLLLQGGHPAAAAGSGSDGADAAGDQGEPPRAAGAVHERAVAAAIPAAADAAPAADAPADIPQPAARAADTEEAAAAPAPALDLVDESDPLATAHCKGQRRRSCQPHTRERVAADLLIEGRLAEAAARYRQLAADTGDQRFATFADLVAGPSCTAEDCP